MSLGPWKCVVLRASLHKCLTELEDRRRSEPGVSIMASPGPETEQEKPGLDPRPYSASYRPRFLNLRIPQALRKENLQ